MFVAYCLCVYWRVTSGLYAACIHECIDIFRNTPSSTLQRSQWTVFCWTRHRCWTGMLWLVWSMQFYSDELALTCIPCPQLIPKTVGPFKLSIVYSFFSCVQLLLWWCQIWRWMKLLLGSPQLVPKVSPRWPPACSFECGLNSFVGCVQHQFHMGIHGHS